MVAIETCMCRLGVSRYRNVASSPVSCSIVASPSLVGPCPSRRPWTPATDGVRHLRALSEDGAMASAWVYLAVSLVGAVLVANAFRPAPHRLLEVPSFFAGWYTAEMPVWHIVWQVAATVVFALVGALGSWPGWVALGINVAAWTGLVVLARISRSARFVFSRPEGER